MDAAVSDMIEELARGTLETGRSSRFSLGNSGVGLGTISSAVPRSLTAETEDVRAEIVAGNITIASRCDIARVSPPWIETQTVPSQEATSVGAWRTGTRPTTRRPAASIGRRCRWRCRL